MKAYFHGILFFLSACLLPISVMAQGLGTPDPAIGIPHDLVQANWLVAGKVKTVQGDPMRGATLMVPRLVAAGSGILATDAGLVEGAVSADSKVRIFKGIPFAAPPVGALRWKAPQPVPSWTGVRKATDFGARCMQGRIFEDMIFRDSGPSEDCLYLNVWTPATSSQAHLPVMVWIYGGGFAAGSASEPRQDGENLAKKGVVVVSFNYRLGVFGFLSHPDLSKESGHNASGNYGLWDQVAALEWVRRNIAAFGGDPDNVTIFGESAGSFSVSALMASPLAQGLFQRAIGESGAFFSVTLGAKPLAVSEQADQKFTDSLGVHSLEALRTLPADALLEAARKQGMIRFWPIIDGYFLPEEVRSIFASGKQSKVPLLAGWNADEGDFHAIFAGAAPTAPNFVARAQTLFGDKADAFLKLYPAGTDDQAKRSAQDLAGDQFIAFSTWKWIELQAATGNSRVFRYEFDDAPPSAAKDSTAPSRGAYHSAEIEFVFEALASKNLPWRPEDEKLSDLMSSYWTNFAKTGDPNGPGLPPWPAYSSQGNYEVMHLSASPYSAPDEHRGRYEFLDALPPHK
ncbi:MAG: carboxylesterase/lipase family protein [Terriglobia bacterium]|jgi:para-nitrobenzyl esterase